LHRDVETGGGRNQKVNGAGQRRAEITLNRHVKNDHRIHTEEGRNPY